MEISTHPFAEKKAETPEISYLGMNEADFVAQCSAEHDSGNDFVESVREELTADLLLYKNQKEQEDLIGDTTLYNVHRALMARSYVDKPQALFQATAIGLDEAVESLNAVFKEDDEEQDMGVLKYYKEFYKNLFGVGIIARVGWDGDQKRNIYQYVDPRVWVPDRNGDYLTGDYSFTGFEKVFYKSELLALGVSEEKLESIKDFTSRHNGPQDVKEADQRSDGLLPDRGNSYDANPLYECYWHFTKILKDGKYRKVRVLLDIDCTTILKFDEVEPVSKAERKNPELVRFPFTFWYYSPEPNNPFGDRPANKVRDVQKAKAIIANLRLQKSKAELYPMYLVNQRYVAPKTDLSFGFNKFLMIDSGQDGPVNLDSVVRPMQKDFRADNSFIIDDSLDRQVEASTSIGKVVQGATPEGRDSATRAGLIQSNTDINLSLLTKVNNFGERNFVKDWLRGYLENFSDADQKIVLMKNGLTVVPVTLTKKEFLVEDQVKIMVVSTGEIEAKKRKDQMAINAILPLLQTNPNASEAAKNHAFRLACRANGIEEIDAAQIVQETPQETDAKIENEQLRNNFWVNVEPTDDDMVHLAVHNGAGDNPTVQMHKWAHIQQYIAKGQPKPELPGAEDGGGAMNEAMTAAVSQQSSNIGAQAAQTEQLPVVSTN